MNDHRFILTPYKSKQSRHTCPACDQRSEFALYIDKEGKYRFPDNVGRCNRESSCGYHYTPAEFFKDNPDELKKVFDNKGVTAYSCNVSFVPPSRPTPPPKPTEYFDERTLLATMTCYDRNTFTNALQTIFDTNQINSIIQRYRLGTTKAGAVVFWQVDASGRVRYGKAMHYLADLHRDKSKHPVAVHSLMDKHDFNHKQCFFGEHLLSLPENKNKAVAILESEKSACICSEVLPDYIWLATGGKNGVKWTDKDVCSILSGHKVIIFPDVDAHKDWSEKASILKGFGIQVSVYQRLVEVAPGTQQDIADHLIIDLIRKKSNGVKNLIPEVQQSNKSIPANPIIEAMTAKNPALHTLIQTFECEVTATDKYEPQPGKALSNDELMKLGAGLPDYNSFTPSEISTMLQIGIDEVKCMIATKAVYHIQQNDKYCKLGGIPF